MNVALSSTFYLTQKPDHAWVSNQLLWLSIWRNIHAAAD
jgi:hypothetical protein